MFAIAVHGGAGKWSKEKLNRGVEVLERAAGRGLEVMLGGGSPMDAVEEAVKILEDEPLFNAGTGSALSIDGRVEMDACIVLDNPRVIGSVIGVSNIKNPISLARLIAERTSHHIMYGEGAERVGEVFGIQKADVKTDESLERLEELRRRIFENGMDVEEYSLKTVELIRKYPEMFIGTVGAVATDGKSVCAGTSTGGTYIKLPGRVGDTPVPGAGTWAEGGVGASATGIGEGIIQILMTKRFCDFVLGGMKPQEAAEKVVKMCGYPAGIVGVDRFGNLGVYYNTKYMPTAFAVFKGNKKEVVKYGIHA